MIVNVGGMNAVRQFTDENNAQPKREIIPNFRDKTRG